MASLNGHTEIVALLLANSAGMNTKDNDGWTPLMWAEDRGHLDVVRTLLVAGAEEPER